MIIRVTHGDDDEFEGEALQSWTWEGDPLMAVFETAQDAMKAADVFYGEALDWWEEEDDYWLADVDDAEDEKP